MTTPASAARFSLDLREQKAAVQSAPRKLMKAAAAPKSAVLRQGRLAAGATKVAPLNVGDTLGLQLFEGAEVELTLKELTDGSMGGRSFLAEANGYAGVKNAVVVETADGLQIDIQDYKTGKVYTVYSGASGVVVKELAPVRGQTVPTAEPPPPEMLLSMTEPEATGLLSSNPPGDTRLDILVAFDANARSYAELQGGGMTNFAQVAVQKMNAALANTGLSELFRFRLVGVMAVDVTERDVYGALYAISAGEGGWAAIAEKREEVGADLVTTLIDTGSACGTVGVGWSLSDGMDSAIFSESAYNVCAIQSVAQSHTMTHECGHNLGAGHSERQMTEPGPQLYDYSAGYYFTVDGTSYHTIMAYDDDGHGNSYTEVPYFSSPDYTYLGVPVGDATHDNTRTLRNTFAAASAWREQTVPMTYDVSFSPASGATFAESISVTLTAEKPDVVIRYTTDGSVPTVDSLVYSGPIILTSTTTIRAIAVEDGVGGVPFEAKYWKADLGVALGAPELEWKTSPENPWQVQTDTTLDGLAVAGTAGSWLSATVEGPASISLYGWATSYGEEDDAVVSLCMDGVTVFNIVHGYNTCGFEQQAYDIPEGVHEIKLVCDYGQWLIDRFEICYSRRPTCKSFTWSNGLEKKVTLSHDNPQSTILFTLDGSAPTAETAIKYAGPFFVSGSVTVRAVAYEPGRGPSVEMSWNMNLIHTGQHGLRAGEWTPDANCALESAKRDGRLVVVYYGSHETCGFSREFESYAEDEEFLAWAAVNGIYLIVCDYSRYENCRDAESLFCLLAERAGIYTSRAPTLEDIIYLSTPSLVVAAPDGLDGLSRPLDGHVGSTFRSVRELAAYFAPFLGGGELLERPQVISPSTQPETYPFEVALANPNGTGDIYFTLDGSEPTRENGTKYEGPVTVAAAGTILKAVVWEGVPGGVSGLPLVMNYGTAEGGGDDEPEVSAPHGVTGMYVESNGPLLRWESVEGAVFYRVYAADIDDFSSAALLGESKLPQYWDFAAVSESRYYWVTSVGEKETEPSSSVRIEGIKPCVEFDLGEHGAWETGIPMKKRVSVAFGQSAVAPTMYAGPGRRFVGWSEDVSCVRSNMSVVARYEPAAIEPFTSDVVADWYVDQTNGSDGNRGDSYNAPFASLQKAVDVASDRQTIIVNDGIYAPIDVLNDKDVEIRSLRGWPVTIIDGGKTNRCVTMTGGRIVGFTLRNGSADMGGGISGGRATCCLIIGNVAQIWYGGGSYGCAMDRCIITGNSGGGGGAAEGVLDGCILHGNSGGGADCCIMNNCVVIENHGGAESRCELNNCIVTENEGGYLGATFPDYCYVCTDDRRMGGVGVLHVDPGFANAEQGDYRLRSDSPCIDAGLDYPEAFGQLDLGGDARVQGSHIDIGAYESVGELKVPNERPPATIYVDAGKGSDANDGMDEHHPFRTIQSAIEESVDGDEIVVNDGVYSPICTFGRKLDIRSVNGAERTVIDGANKSRCARLASRSSHYDEYSISLWDDLGDSALTGFTLQNGFGRKGGGSLGGRLNACVLSDNVGYYGGGANSSVLNNSLIVKNEAYKTGGGASDGTIINCTVVGNRAYDYGGGLSGRLISNSIVWGNVLKYGDCTNMSQYCSYTCTTPLQDGEVNLCADPLFVDAANGDYRLRADSPCINAGDNSAVVGTVDLLGNNRISGGRVDMGAFEYQAPGIHFYPNGGTGVMTEQPITGASIAALSLCTLTRTGYTFAGWSTSPKGEVVYADGAPVDGLPTEPGAVFVLYAQWLPRTYTVRFDANGGLGVMADQLFVYGESLTLASNKFSKADFSFFGWEQVDGDGTIYADCQVVHDLTAGADDVITLRAIWAGCTYSVEDGRATIYAGWFESAVYPPPVGEFAVPSVLGGCPVTTLGDTAFCSCDRMTSVTIPASVTNLGSYVFYGCTSLRFIEVAADNPAFSSEDGILYDKEKRKVICCPQGKTYVHLAATIVEIGEYAFGECRNLREIELPPGLKEIGAGAFEYCDMLESVTIPEGVTSIGYDAFYGCSSLSEVSLPNTLRTIGGYAFGCTLLEAIELPASLQRIEYYAFYAIPTLTAVCFRGNAPSEYASYDLYAYSPNVTNYVREGSVGWKEPGSVELPEAWPAGDYARPIRLWEGEPALQNFRVTYDLDGGVNAEENPLSYNAAALPITLAEPTRDGWRFVGWQKDGVIVTQIEEGATGDVSLTAMWESLVPSNDNFANADVLAGISGAITSENAWATSEEDEPLLQRYSSARTVWWKWTAPANGSVAFDTVGSSFDTVMGVYTGDALSSLTTITQDDDGAGNGASRCEFDCLSGMTYYICVGGYDAASGDIALRWAMVSYAVTYQNLQGAANTNVTEFTTNDLPLVLGPVEREGWRFLGWTPDGGVIPAGTVTNVTFTANWEEIVEPPPVPPIEPPEEPINPPEDPEQPVIEPVVTNTIMYLNLQGAANTNVTEFTTNDLPLVLGPVEREGYVFLGWTPDGGVIPAGTVTNVTFTAVWEEIVEPPPVEPPEEPIEPPEEPVVEPVVTNTITYVGLEGAANTNVTEFTTNDLPLVLGPVEREGWRFLGWTPWDGVIPEGTVTNVTFTANWEEIVEPPPVPPIEPPVESEVNPWRKDADFSAAVANTYDGYVIDENYNLLGIVQVKTTKQSSKGVVTATATVTDANGKKWSYSKGVVELVSAPVAETATVRDVGVVTGLKCTAKGCPAPEFGVTLGQNGMDGAWGEYAIFGARNGMGTKGDAMKTALEEAYKGKWSVTLSAPVAETATVRLQLDVQAKGVVKIAGNWENGAKVSASAQLVMGDGFAYVPVMVKSTKTSPALNALLRIDAECEVVLLSVGSAGETPPPQVEMALVDGGRTVDALGEPVYLPSEVSAGGKAFSARVAVNELAYPAKFAVKKLPAGLKIDAATGVISGTPTKPGHYVAEVTVSSGLNSKVKKTLTVEFDIANYTDDLIPIEDSYGPYYVGVSAVEQIAAAADCTVSGLPSGLKWTAKDVVDTKTKEVKTAANTVYGIPTKSGTSTVYFKKTVKEMVNGKQKSVTHQASATFVVEGMQPWAIGTFDGGSSNGIVTLTVAKTGKLSGKWMSEGLTWTLSAAAFDAYISSKQMYVATLIGKSGKLVMTNEIEVTESGVSSPLFEAWRNGWKDEPQKSLATKLKGQKVPVGEVLLTVGANGTVTAKGTFGSYSASCSTVLIPTESEGRYVVYLYFPPKAGKFAGWSGEVGLRWDGTALVSE